MADLYLPCDACGGKRFKPEMLEVSYRGKHVAQVLELTVDEAIAFFSGTPAASARLYELKRVGLGYLRLGQPAPTLSGGEAQRLKLATELTRGIGRAQHERSRKMRKPKSTLYLLEEPTIRLHMADVELLLNLLHRLVDDGHTVI